MDGGVGDANFKVLKEDEQRVKKIKMLNYKLANRKLNFGHEIFEIDKKPLPNTLHSEKLELIG